MPCSSHSTSRDGVVDERHADPLGVGLEEIDEVAVLDVVGEVVRDVGRAFGTAREDSVVLHERHVQVGVLGFLVAVVAGGLGQRLPLERHARGKAVVKVIARAPVNESQPELPGGLRDAIELGRIDCQVGVQVSGEADGGAFADADHADFLAADDGHVQKRVVAERDRRQQAGATAAKDCDALNGLHARDSKENEPPRLIVEAARFSSMAVIVWTA